MIARAILQIVVTLSAVLAGFYVVVWRVRRRLRPAALLANAKENFKLELQSATLEWTDFTCRDNEFTTPDFAIRLAVLAHLASSLEVPTPGDLGGPAPGHAIS
jgi:hypothetical protein